MPQQRAQFLRSSRRCFVALALILGVQVVLGFAAAVSDYDGFCYGFTDGKFPCTLGERAVHEISFLSILSWLLPPIPLFFWGIALGRMFAASVQLRPALSIVLTLALAFFGGALGFLIGIHFADFLRAVVKAINI